MRHTAEGVRVDDILHDCIERGDTRHGDREVPHRTLGVGGLDKVCHFICTLPGQPFPRWRLTYKNITLSNINLPYMGKYAGEMQKNCRKYPRGTRQHPAPSSGIQRHPAV